MTRVLHLITSFGLGGAETNLFRLVSHMDCSRFSNTVVTMTDARLLSSRLAEANVPFHSLGMSRGVPNPLAATRLFRIIKRVQPDILQTWMYHADLLGLLVGKVARVPAIVWNVRCSSMDMTRYRRASAVVVRMLVSLSRYPDVVVANSEAGLRSHQALGYRARRWKLIPNSLDVDQFRPDGEARTWLRRELKLEPEAIIIGLIARYDPMKDHANFIAAARLLADEMPTVHFVLVGWRVDSSNGDLTRRIESNHLTDRFHLLGLRQDINRITAGLDVACSSSAYGEGSSNAVAEAMACGVPCVVTNVGDSALLVAKAGKIVAPRDPDALARGCREIILMTPRQRERLDVYARQRVLERFSIPSIVARYERLYEALAPASGSDPQPLVRRA
jgi:glycosyltransferase involved in cell wall biosynthesis